MSSAGLERHLEHQLKHARGFFWHRLRWRVVSEYLPKDRPFVLADVGAGTGVLGGFLERDRPQASYRFIEPIDFLERHLEQRFGATANAKTLEALSDADFVTVLDVVEHQADDRAFVADIVGPMRRNAVLLITVPALRWLWSEWDVALGHHRRYDKDTLSALLDRHLLDVREVSYLFPEMIVPGFFRKRSRGRDATAEIPELPRPVNAMLYGIGRATVPLRRFLPVGTSLFAAARRI